MTHRKMNFKDPQMAHLQTTLSINTSLVSFISALLKTLRLLRLKSKIPFTLSSKEAIENGECGDTEDETWNGREGLH
ncbi:hypothetical protein PIB30_021533 [Stylosanthes scabra]|uniref:Uncharacterized protein n=1 Tax=Stylosanthes scabra TaxID=79078 RepID=A0ABU6R986_9FABA|nr:hypothetical protein [Stylosanthes scabra]